MLIKVEKTGKIDAFVAIATQMAADPNVKALLILAADANGFTPENIDLHLQKLPIPIIGGIFPALIDGEQCLNQGTIVAGILKPTKIFKIDDLSNSEANYVDDLDQSLGNTPNTPTIMVFVDGFAKRIGSFIESLFTVLGLESNFVGGGAGSLSMVQKPCLFSNQGLIQDAGMLALLDVKSGLGVNHGWESIAGPFLVSDSENTIIKTLNHKPAFEVYKEIVENHSQRKFTADNFFDIAKAYPFGISKVGAERVVRDPLFLGENDSLVCVGEVLQGSFVDILNGNETSLITAAENAKIQSKAVFNDPEGTRFFIDCISRVLFLGERFEEELRIVKGKSTQMIGACTLGEIANNGNSYLEFYNKTAVVINFDKEI